MCGGEGGDRVGGVAESIPLQTLKKGGTEGKGTFKMFTLHRYSSQVSFSMSATRGRRCSMSSSECLVLEGGPLLLLKVTEGVVGSWISHPGLGRQKQVDLCDFEIILVSIAPGQTMPHTETVSKKKRLWRNSGIP